MTYKTHKPQVIILYGPPLAGKGTQGDFLEHLLPDYVHIDFGTELRRYVTENIGNVKQTEKYKLALRLKERMNAGQAVLTEDLRSVIEERIVTILENNQHLLIEGPGRLIEEAEWLAKFMGHHDLSIAIFHLHISLEEALRRSKLRYYAPGNNLAFIGYETAKAACKNGEEPYQRPEDLDPAINTKRYENLYDNVFAEILSIYQLIAKAKVFIVDAKRKIPVVSNDIREYLERFYNMQFDQHPIATRR